MRFRSILILLFAASIAYPQVSGDRSPNLGHEATGAGFDGVLLRNKAARHCAHIVISEVPGIDTKILKSIGKFSSNMPMLQVPPPCYQDSARDQPLSRLSCDFENKCR